MINDDRLTFFKTDLGALLTQNKTINMEKNLNQNQKIHYSHHINNLSGNAQSQWSIEKEEKSQVHVDGETQETHEKINSGQLRQDGLSWPFAGYFPIVINDPFLTAYNAITSSMYSAFSSMIEYGPEADICRSQDHSHKSLVSGDDKSDEKKEDDHEKVEKTDGKKEAVNEKVEKVDEKKEKFKEEMEKIDEMKVNTQVKIIMPDEKQEPEPPEIMETPNPDFFDEIRLEAVKLPSEKREEVATPDSLEEEEMEEEAQVKEAAERSMKEEETSKDDVRVKYHKSKRDTTNIFMKIKNGGMIDINVQEPDIKR